MTLDLNKTDTTPEQSKLMIGGIWTFIVCMAIIIIITLFKMLFGGKALDPATHISIATIWGKTLTSIGLSAIGVTYLWKNKIDEWDWWGLMIIGAIVSVICLLWDVDISKIKSVF